MTVNDTTLPTIPPVKTTTDREIGIVVSGDGKDQDVAQQTNNLTKQETFSPTPAMQVWIDTAIDIVSDSPTEIEAISKITRQSWYGWLKIPGFEDWYYSEYKKRRRRWLPTLDVIGMRNAKRDYNYWKDMKKTAGDDVEGKQTTNIQLNNLITVE